MNTSLFFRTLLLHVTCAATTLFVVLLVGEFFVPGVVLPFVNVIDLSFPLLVLLGLCVRFPPRTS
ncbi:MAG: hypothetical protein WC787_04995 [Patescibacteria group bacterium]